jgi:phosphatidylglycerophosphate synthase
MFGVVMYSVYTFHIFSSAESDIMNPQYEQYATFSEQSNNPNESGSAIMAVLVSVIVFIIAFLLSSKSNDGVWLKLALISLALAVFKVITYLAKIKAFYKEKQ